MPTALRSKGFIAVALLPALLLFLMFVIVPVFWSAYYGFFSWKGFGAASFIGLDNYREMFQDGIFWRALRNNLILVASSIIGQIPIALLLALLLLKNTLFSRFVRSAVFMPMVLSTVVVGLIWGYIYQTQFGLANTVLRMIGLESWTRAWLSDPQVNMLAISIPINWSNVGPYLVIFIAALQNISPEVDDAAKIDGAVGWRKLLYVTLPMIWGTVVVTLVLCISGSLKAFDHVIVMTGGGPARSTELLATYMYNSTFDVYRYGYGSAVSTMIILISALLIGINYILTRQKSG
ncbi:MULTISPECIES: carbohydrate ABC transporter permease [Paenibacillus]|uniref:ABC transporter permease protein YurN n=1 Tax=Paenibacillus vini TaxID=1476024 RepID=A0ABQ4M9J6_9BACL|nr:MULTISPECIES: sugar ABC transporter permease [Paenibacillus]MBQ4899766.1 sugar ABC transporter permease [Paenibacillus sp. Marseille-P2973]MDN4068958.1 sugar ABC transporter permease [Paenibacillus vini]GIP52655.1 putative ABC transporter permease protein YurN [Paenibacillus vini]